MMRTSNPALSESTFQNFASTDEAMSIQGTILKSFFLIVLVIAAAALTWSRAYPDGWSIDSAPVIPGWYLGAAIAGLIVAFIIIFKKNTAPLLAPVYAVLQGATLGALSATFEHRFPGIVLQAVLGTCGTFIALLLAYQSGVIKATENFKLGVVAATGGIAIVYLIDFGLNFFGMRVPYLHENGIIGIGVSVVIVIIAALNLVLDFDFIEKGAEERAPKFMEWYAAFGLLVTLIWLYLEILRLLSKTKK